MFSIQLNHRDGSDPIAAISEEADNLWDMVDVSKHSSAFLMNSETKEVVSAFSQIQEEPVIEDIPVEEPKEEPDIVPLKVKKLRKSKAKMTPVLEGEIL